MSTDPFELGAADGAEMGPPDEDTVRAVARIHGTDLREQDKSSNGEDAA